MLKKIRQCIVQRLWTSYRSSSSQIQLIEHALTKKGIGPLLFDHFAVIDLPGPHTGIPMLSELFSLLGFTVQGRGYLPDKQNDFAWMAENGSLHQPANQVLPQVVAADFRLAEMPPAIKKIIEAYARLASPLPLDAIRTLVQQAKENDEEAAATLIDTVCQYLTGRDWPLPSQAEFQTVWDFNQLLAWVLVFGRRPNHFTLSIHLLPAFTDLENFHRFIEEELHLQLNHAGGTIKGGRTAGIAQSATMGALETIHLSDGHIELPLGFVEFVWRYAKEGCQHPVLWGDFFPGFIANQATHVIQSLTPGYFG